jgi:hypothetical protein
MLVLGGSRLVLVRPVVLVLDDAGTARDGWTCLAMRRRCWRGAVLVLVLVLDDAGTAHAA